jgi:hypothetical protein
MSLLPRHVSTQFNYRLIHDGVARHYWRRVIANSWPDCVLKVPRLLYLQVCLLDIPLTSDIRGWYLLMGRWCAL